MNGARSILTKPVEGRNSGLECCPCHRGSRARLTIKSVYEKPLPLLGGGAEHLVTFDRSSALLERGDHLVGDAPNGIHHDFARDR